jgi:hypothetical protein
LATILLTAALALRAADIPPATTLIQDTIYRANGTPARGTVVISWGSDSAGLIGRFTTREFALDRTSRPADYYLRAFDGSTPPRYSDVSTMLHVDYPL